MGWGCVHESRRAYLRRVKPEKHWTNSELVEVDDMTTSKWWGRVEENERATHWTSAAASTVTSDRKLMPLKVKSKAIPVTGREGP
jgi:hypothetical protein